MGRYYYGNIAGKFWFGVQDSTDARNIGGKVDKLYQYVCCGCSVENLNTIYCAECYSDFDLHFNDALENEDFEEDEEEQEQLIREAGEYQYFFNGRQLEEVRGHIADLEKVVSKFVKSFTIDAEDEYKYDLKLHEKYEGADCGFTSEIKGDELELLARWCLAKQVEKCIIDKGQCIFFGDE